MPKHIADAEDKFVVTNINPDFCCVDGAYVAFDISQVLVKEKADYSKDVFSRGGRVLKVGSVIEGVVGNAGEGVLSGVSVQAGHSITIEGSDLLFVNGKKTCHHGHKVLMNVKVGG
jgi:hypothetical protein